LFLKSGGIIQNQGVETSFQTVGFPTK